MTCKYCSQDLQPNSFAQPRHCAFESGTFDGNNWACALMEKLRGYAVMNDVWVTSADETCMVLAIPLDCTTCGGFVIMTMYKLRGRTGQAVVMCDEMAPVSLKLEQAEEILSLLERK